MTETRCAKLLSASRRARILVVGDVILDHFLWGKVRRISPEAPVPVVDFERESFMPGGAANVALNLARLGARPEIFGVIGSDLPGAALCKLLSSEGVKVGGLVASKTRPTSVKMRIVSLQQQIARVDREEVGDLSKMDGAALAASLGSALSRADAVIIGDYGKGVISQKLLDELRNRCAKRRVWISIDPKPTHKLNLRGLSLITPNRREAFALAELRDESWNANPLKDAQLMKAVRALKMNLGPKALLVTLGELGMMLCEAAKPPVHIGTVAKEVFDVSGAGDTVIASFTLAKVLGATNLESARISNHAAGIVVGKFGTSTVTADELVRSFSAR